MSIGQRISEIRQNTPRKTFAMRVGIVENTLRNYEMGLSLPNSDVISRICSEFNISPIWLLSGTGEMLQDDVKQKSQEPSDIVMIPLVKARLSAGGGSFETHGGLGKEYSFRHDFLARKGNPRNMVLMRVSGDSMQPEIMDNDVVLIDQSKVDIQQGKMFAVGFEDCIYLKRIDLLPGQVILTSTNKDYAPVTIDLNDDSENLFRVIGKVLWCGREYM